jgi:uncharacterized DUF497 family protein
MKLIWDQRNIAHIARHRVAPEEVNQAIADPRRVQLRARAGRYGYRRYKIVGQTLSGRYLRVLLDLMPEGFYTVTAFAADAADRRAYNRRH